MLTYICLSSIDQLLSVSNFEELLCQNVLASHFGTILVGGRSTSRPETLHQGWFPGKVFWRTDTNCYYISPKKCHPGLKTKYLRTDGQSPGSYTSHRCRMTPFMSNDRSMLGGLSCPYGLCKVVKPKLLSSCCERKIEGLVCLYCDRYGTMLTTFKL